MRYAIPETPAAWTALGVALHEAFCEWEKRDRQIDVLEYFEAQYDAYINEKLEKQPDLSLWQLPPGTKSVEASIKNYKKRGLEKDVPLYRDRCLEAEWEIFRFPDGSKALELPFEIELGDVTVRGTLDRIQWWPSIGATLEDTKSGNVDEFDHRQLGVYSYAAEVIYGISIEYGRYWFTKVDRGGEWLKLDRYTEEYLTELFAAADAIIDQRLLLPNPGKHCGLCGVKPYCREMGSKSV